MEKTHLQHLNQSNKRTFEACTKYIDTSKSVLDYYQSKTYLSGQQKHLNKINSWLEEQDSKALVIKTQPGCGCKSLLSQWDKGIKQSNMHKKEKILNIMHFASGGSNDSNYFYSLYQIIIKLKQSLRLKQNVDLLEENIRKFFSYWLDIVSSQVQKQQVIFCASQIYSKIVIVIEGVDRFIDPDTGKQSNIAFWLPQHFPKNVKVIVTARKNSESILHLQRISCQTIQLHTDAGIVDQLFEKQTTKDIRLSLESSQKYAQILEKIIPTVLKGNNCYSYIEFYSNVFLPSQTTKQWLAILQSNKMSKSKLQNAITLYQLFILVLQNCSDNNQLKQKIDTVLITLSLAQKGLTIKQLNLLSKMNDIQWIYFKGIFGHCIVQYQNLYQIKCRWLVQCVLQHEKQKHGDNFNQTWMGWHQKIAKALQNTENSIRKLEQQAYHLFCAKSYFRLKQMVSNIQNFLLLFNPHNKYQLSRYWQKLQQRGFDPVIQYNKAVQGFSMHYHPSDQNIFRIIVQISRFLKQFCDFQTYDTPKFRHPYIQGNMLQLQKIGLLTQLSNLQIYFDNSFNNIDLSLPQNQKNLSQQIQQLKQMYFPKDSQKPQDLLKGLERATSEQESSNNKHKRKNQYPKILSQIQQLNVDVPMNKNKFRQHYLRGISQLIKKQEETTHQQGGYLDVQQYAAVNNNQKGLNSVSFQKIKQNYRMRQIKPSLYYYKRWIWIQFPWICISLNNNYSTTPQLRKNIQGEDGDSYEIQYKYTRQTLMVAIQARQKKKQMFSKKDGATFQGSKMQKSKFTITKNTNFRQGTSVSKQKITPQIDLSLQSLSKQLESRQKNIEQQNTGDKQNCDHEMKFISLRREFTTPQVWKGSQAQQVLPRVKWAIKQHTNYELEYIKNNIEEKKKKLNKIIYQNKRLSDIYQQLKIKEALTKKNLLQQQQHKGGKKGKALQDLIKKKQEVITQFCKSLLQKQRLKIILKLCSQNKTRNQQYLASLNYFLQNLKKMINSQKQNMKSIAQNLQSKKVSNQKLNALQQQKNQNKRIVEQQAQKYIQQKIRLQKHIESIKQNIWDDIQDQKDKIQNNLSGNLKHYQQKNQIKQQQKTMKQLEDRLDKASHDYQRLKQLFEIQDPNTPSPRMQYLLQQNQRNKQLKIIYFEKKNRIQQLQRQLQKVKEQNQKQVKRQLKICSNIKKNKKVVCGRDAFSQQKLEILMDNLCMKLGVRDKNQIVEVLQKRLNQRSVKME